MSKMAKKRKHNTKMQKKRAAKAAKKAKFAALVGTSKKAKRQGNKSQISSIHKHAHVMADCGNAGCQRCHPRRLASLPKVA